MTGRERDLGLDDERLREAFAALAEEDRPTAACPDGDRLWDAARGRATPVATAAIVDHLVGCGACAEAWRLAIALPADDGEAAEAATRVTGDADAGGAADANRVAEGPDITARSAAIVVPLRDRARPRPRARWTRYAAAGATALAMAAAIVLLLRGGSGPRSAVEPRLDELEVIRAGTPHRTDTPKVGDLLRVGATAAATAHAELRVYRDGHELIARCPSPTGPTAGCDRRGDRITVDVPMPRLGSYRAVLLTSRSPLPAPTDSLDRDTAAAAQVGARYHLSDPVDLQ